MNMQGTNTQFSTAGSRRLPMLSFVAGVATWTLVPVLSVVVVWITGSAQKPYWPFFWPAAAALMAVTSGHLTRQQSILEKDWRLSLSTTGLLLGYIYLGVLGLMQSIVWLYGMVE